ncbi:MAG: 3-hydroxyacyl-CoA dehydrogenase NAD-binding domain-containing protein [Natronomonas sp.]|jgi:enoyl-CoA hydratase/3-hydroxyacyl-CoA dehydrogenase|uniref:3-hydroxyacyl-CoA dehydrogenase/enoyl-CoA hydratase family protein n=1 Tax=Natronomonas sp. TaxID=2184060 RepID=UPI00286FC2CD|nr:3-hydroxyacyl-CoA dehydrogenase NAD-binding domain-containing protein [Natronomonas sp.]MDR9431120.1 3-hydroxyacyl-CoA dehydrogenase NAD-binding domain-containing protein [Natronomonas sp.]
MEIDDIETIAVLGAGNMGHGIAEVAALAGYSVNLRDIKEEFVQNGYEQIEWSLEKLAEKDIISDKKAESALENVSPYVGIEAAVGDADFVIEAVPEKMEIKKDVYDDVEKHLPDHAIIASNTSSLSITDLSEQTNRPEKFCGMHFFNPPVQMQLVEVISGGHTADETLDVTEALAEDLDKTPVRVRKDSPGFIVNRILVPLMNEVCWMVSEDDATVAEIDSTTKFDMGLPMGVFELSDMTGHDITYHVLEYMHEVLGDVYEPAPFLEELIDEERYGKKSGRGVYDYEDGDGVDIPADAGREDITTRLIALMANEVGNLVGDDVSHPAAIDEAVMLGAGFPDGPAKIADDAGLETLVETLESLHDETGHPRFEVSDGLREAAERGGFFGGESGDDLEFTNIEVRYPGDMVGQIVLDREARMNTINPELLEEFDAAIDALEADDEVRAILITGKGDRAFSAGADVTSMAGNAEPIDAIELSRKGQRTFGKLEECDVPVVAGIDGFALGGGFELALACDFRLASARSELGTPEHNLGLLPGWGGTQRLGRIAGFGRAKEIIFTAERYDAETMYDYDVVTEVVDNDAFDERVHEFAADLAGGPPISQKLTKRAMIYGWEDIDAGLELEAQAFGHLMHTDDLTEGITAFMGDDEPEFEGK